MLATSPLFLFSRKIEEGLWESASGVVSIVYGKTLSVKRILKNSLFLDNVLTLKADNPKKRLFFNIRLTESVFPYTILTTPDALSHKPSSILRARILAPYLQDILVKVKYVPMDAAASFVESLYNTAYEIDSYGVMPEEGEVLDDSYMVFQVRGDSMEPTIPDGAKILEDKELLY